MTNDNEKYISPFVKWIGGKGEIVKHIINLFPSDINTYYEPFLGGGSILFSLRPSVAVVNDINSELINCYNTIRDSPDLILKELENFKNESDFYYQIRELDRKNDFHTLSNVFRASRFIYLNKTCFNGLYRVNNRGKFNAAFGKKR